MNCGMHTKPKWFFLLSTKKSKFQNLLSSDQSKYVFYVLQDFHLLRCLVSIKVALCTFLGPSSLLWDFSDAIIMPVSCPVFCMAEHFEQGTKKVKLFNTKNLTKCLFKRENSNYSRFCWTWMFERLKVFNV